MPRIFVPTYGDNIFELGGCVSATLRAAKWSDEKIDPILRAISDAKSYDEAVAVCARYITIADLPSPTQKAG